MKLKLAALILATFAGAPSAFAGSCDEVFNQISSWLAGDGNLIRIVTTGTGRENSVSYTRGYLEESESTQGTYESSSSIYSNDGDVEAPFRRLDNGVEITLSKVDGDVAQVTYTQEGADGISAVFLMRCSNGLLHTVSANGVLAVSFRYSTVN